MIRPIHPFPARMAPGLALDNLEALTSGSVVLDPMSGSGTVLRQALELGHDAIGFDVDPLAVLMSSVWTTPIDDSAIGEMYQRLAFILRSPRFNDTPPWLSDRETEDFTKFWFAERQRAALGKISYALWSLGSNCQTEPERAAVRVLELALSRIIVTKEQAASLARDTSHSRPHRTSTSTEYDVFKGYEKAVAFLRQRLRDQPPSRNASVRLGDARALTIGPQTVDAVVTSPPYLNAIDYLRGHRLALVWLGWSIPRLRDIRSNSIGAERAPDAHSDDLGHRKVVQSMIGLADIIARHRRMIERYAADLCRMVSEIARTIKSGGRAVFVVGNSCLKGTFIQNSEGVATAAEIYGLKEVARSERELPARSRYLPVTGPSLAKRMRTETILSFVS